jgi:hypothetical protein
MHIATAISINVQFATLANARTERGLYSVPVMILGVNAVLIRITRILQRIHGDITFLARLPIQRSKRGKIMQKDSGCTQIDHSAAERIWDLCENSKMFVVWWTYSANYSEPKIVIAKTPADAFRLAFPQYAHTNGGEFHKYAVEIRNCGCATELREDKTVLIGSREYCDGYPEMRNES